MQSFAPLSPSDFLDPVQELLWRLEVYDGAAWVDLSALDPLGSGSCSGAPCEDYLESVSISLGGAGVSVKPIAGSWSATINNESGIFHPLHPTSAYADLLRVGREVRISVGGNYGGVDRYWPRIIGFMDAPQFDHGSRTVSIEGADYSKLLTDTILRDSQEVTESGSPAASGSDAWDWINGPTHWGTYIDLDSVDSVGVLGAEMYTEGDALDIVTDAHNIGTWASVDGTTMVVDDPTATLPNRHVFVLSKDDTSGAQIRHSHHYEDNIGSLTIGKSYLVSFGYKGMALALNESLALGIYKTGTDDILGGVMGLTSNNAWSTCSFYFTATATVAAKAQFTVRGRATAATTFRIDWFSLKEVSSYMNQRYVLPDICNGPYFVTLDGEPVWQGFDEGSGWHYDEFGRMFWLDDTIIVADGTANLRVYFYTTQILENVLADILAGVGLYGTRALALADMDKDATGIEIPRTWFDAGSAAIDAVATICERANYRFWFGYGGKPHFRPAPIADSLEFTFTASDHLKDLSEFQDRANLRNRIIIEGIQQAMYPLSNEDKTNSRLKGEAFDAPSILAYLEHSHSIQNHLFQDQTSVDTMAVELRDDFKNPVWCSDLSLFANPVPLEIGDVIEWPLELEPLDADPGSLSGSESGGITINLLGIIRDIKINDSGANYKVEVVSGLTGAIAHAGAIPSEAIIGSHVVTGPVVELITSSQAWYAPSGFDGDVTVETWAAGGKGAGSGNFIDGSGGGGGGAYSIKVIHCDAGVNYSVQIGNANDRVEANRATHFKNDDTVTILVKSLGGQDAAGVTGGLGGATAGGTGTTKYKGGDSDDAVDEWGTGGGGAAGSTGNGADASGDSGGSATAQNGGPGGNGGGSGQNGFVPVSDYGGGGGGAGAGKKSGAIGKSGLVRLTYWI